MATTTININDKVIFTFTYTFNGSYSATQARISAYISSITAGGGTAHPYRYQLWGNVDSESPVRFGTGVISTSGTVTSASDGTQVFDIDKQHSTKSHSFKVQAVLRATDDSGVGHDKTTTVSISVPAKTSYKVTFNANNGSGGPSSQTKWHGEALSLTTSKPTRTGYTFSHWDTKADGSGTNYSSGGTYLANAAVTLYAY